MPRQRWPWVYDLLPVTVIVVAVLLVYARSLDNGFVGWDDGLLITENPIVRGVTWGNVKAAFTQYDPELYIPLTYLSYQADYAVWGMRPFGFHLTNLVLHTLNAVLVFWLAILLLRSFQFSASPRARATEPKASFQENLKNKERRTSQRATGWTALAVALLWAVHPLNTEAVAWASARKDVLSAFFVLLSIIAYQRHRDAAASDHGAAARTFYMLSLCSFFLGLLSKVTAAAMPAAILLIDWYARRPINRRVVGALLPYVVLSILFIAIAMPGKETGSSFLWEKALIGCKAFLFYLWKITVPFGFSVIYPYTQPIALSTYDLLLSVVGVLTLLVAVLTVYRYGARVMTFAILWYAIFLLPTFNTIAKGHNELQDIYFASDRYAYLASAGVFFWLVFLLVRLCARRIVVMTGIAIVAMVLGVRAARQSLVWKDTMLLFQHVIEHYPNSHVAHTNVGVELFKGGDVDGALTEFRRALAIRPDGMAYYNVGQIHLLRDEPEAAMEAFQNAIVTSPVEVDSYLYFAALLANRSRLVEAESVLVDALTVSPEHPQVHAALGRLWAGRGEKTKAIASYRKALQLEPGNEDVLHRIEQLEKE